MRDIGPSAQGRDARGIRAMFDRIAPTYDRLNHLLSGGIDRRWRDRAVREVPPRARRALDLCAGTLDLSLALRRRRPAIEIVAADFAVEMLRGGREKLFPGPFASPYSDRRSCPIFGHSSLRRSSTYQQVRLRTPPVRDGRISGNLGSLATGPANGPGPMTPALGADATRLPFRSGVFDAVLCAFGVRNLAALDRGIDEVRRVLVPGGVFIVLEFFRPAHAIARIFHRLYARHVLPAVGGAVSGDRDAYRYLSESMERFATRREFEESLRTRGFAAVRGSDLTLGIASVVRGVRA